MDMSRTIQREELGLTSGAKKQSTFSAAGGGNGPR